MARRKGTNRVEPSFGGGRGGSLFVRRREAGPRGQGAKARAQGRAAQAARLVRLGAARPIRGRRGSLLGRFFRRTIYWGVVASIWGILAVAAIVGFYAAQLPGASEWRVPDRPPNVQILAVDGRLIGNRGDTGGETVRIEQLPEYVPEAVVAIEDRRFRSHFGVDPVGLVRAVAKNAFAGDVVEGGSTLTQQLAKNMFLTPERSLKRKVQEVVLAVWLETKYSKDEILEMYLNRVYFGAGAYGIDAAARRYFDREASALTLPQAAMLAGLLPAPSRYAPNRNPDAAQGARRARAHRDARAGLHFARPELTEARDHPARAASAHMSRSENYVADWVMDVLPFHVGAIDQRRGRGDHDRPRPAGAGGEGGRRDARRAGREIRRRRGRHGGGRRHRRRARHGRRPLLCRRASSTAPSMRRRQPGSAFKPFVYLTALERLGYRPDTVRDRRAGHVRQLVAEELQRQLSRPGDAEGRRSPIPSTRSRRSSPTRSGRRRWCRRRKRMGINSPLAANPSIALGTSEVTLLELTGAYAPFSNGGFAVMPYVDPAHPHAQRQGAVQPHGSGLGHVASPQSVAMMNDMLQATVEMGTGTKASIAGWPAGGKTGTSQDFRDAWFIGYTANLTAGVWVGNDSNAPTKHASGANLPAMIWSKFMTGAHAGVPVAQLPGGDLTAFLLAQPAAGAEGWTAAQAPSNDRAANEATMREWILSGGEPAPQAAAAAPAERRGFFRRLFGAQLANASPRRGRRHAGRRRAP